MKAENRNVVVAEKLAEFAVLLVVLMTTNQQPKTTSEHKTQQSANAL